MGKKLVLILFLCIGAISLFSCTGQNSNAAYNEFITNLEKLNFNVVAQDVEEDILQGQRKWLTIDGEGNMSIYIYESNKGMEEDASYIDEGGTSYNNGERETTISWVSYPHFYKKDNIIVLYVGENMEIINALEEILGSQFAGYKNDEDNKEAPKTEESRVADMEANIKDNNYINEKHGFKFEIPASWQGKFKVAEESWGTTFYYTGYENENGGYQEFFSITSIPREEYERALKDPPFTGELLDEKDGRVYIVNMPFDNMIMGKEKVDEYLRMRPSVEEIKERFYVISGYK